MTLDEAESIIDSNLWPNGHPTQNTLREYVKNLREKPGVGHTIEVIEWFERYIEAMDICAEHALNSGEVIK